MQIIKRIILNSALLSVTATTLFAQQIEKSIEMYGNEFPQERIHIHFDRSAYMPGETIWYKAYIFEENLPTARSTNFYAALYDEQGKLVQQRTSPIFNGTTDGHFTVPENVRASQLICRAYTGWMLNFDSAFLYTKPVRIVGKKDVDIAGGRKVQLNFFPEGGHVVEAVTNTIAFKANFDNGLPFNVNVAIKQESTGETLLNLASVHDGMGRFDLEFRPGERYFAEWADHKGVKHHSFLPEAKASGVSLKLMVQKDKLFYNLVNRTGNDSLHVVMFMYQKLFYKKDIHVAPATPFTAVVPVTGLPAGAMQLTVFDANWQPVAERVAFIQNNYEINATMVTTGISTQKRAKNAIDILVADTIPANMSLSITDAELDPGMGSASIMSDLLLSSEIRGYVHNPDHYFSTPNNAEVKAALDLVMLTNGWRRYNWADVKALKRPVIRMPADNYLQAFGQVGPEALGKLVKDEPVNLILKTKDSVNNYFSVVPDRGGYLRQRGLVYFDSAKLYYTFNKSKIFNKHISFSSANATLAQPVYLANHEDHLMRDTAGTGSIALNNPLLKFHQDNEGSKGLAAEKTLQAVTLNSRGRRNWKNDPLLKLEERYVSGMFSGGALGYTIDVLNDEKAWTRFDMYSYIRNMVPGLTIGNYNLAAGRSLTYRERSVLIYIDEHEATNSDLENLNVSEVALIKFIPNFMGRGADAGGASMNPALSVYTRKGDDVKKQAPRETDINMIRIAGYSPIKEFYSPDYSLSNTETQTDARITLLWVPYILTDKNNRKVPVTFYNNDFTKRMRIVLEGIDESGKMIRIEKVVQ